MKKIEGFTLAEVLITLVILGTVAAITIPTTIKKQIESTNKVKLKKAMSTYENVIQKMVIENDIKTSQQLVEYANANDCAKTKAYFKTTEVSGCTFRTSDGMWWDCSDITMPKVSYDKNGLQLNPADEDNYKSFYFVTSYDAKQKTFRTNDLSYEKANPKSGNVIYTAKLDNYITNSDYKSFTPENIVYKTCEQNGANCKTELVSPTGKTVATGCNSDGTTCNQCYDTAGIPCEKYIPDPQRTETIPTTTPEDKILTGGPTYYSSIPENTTQILCDSKGENCKAIDDYKRIVGTGCDTNGTNCSGCYSYDASGNKIAGECEVYQKKETTDEYTAYSGTEWTTVYSLNHAKAPKPMVIASCDYTANCKYNLYDTNGQLIGADCDENGNSCKESFSDSTKTYDKYDKYGNPVKDYSSSGSSQRYCDSKGNCY